MAPPPTAALVEGKETGEKALQKMISNETKLATNNTSRNAEIFMTRERERVRVGRLVSGRQINPPPNEYKKRCNDEERETDDEEN